MAKKNSSNFGSWAFLVGVILALLLSLFPRTGAIWVITLVVIGLIVGLLNISEDEVQHFMMSGAILIIVSYFGMEVMSVVPIFADILQNLLIIFVPATVIVAVKNVFSLARN